MDGTRKRCAIRILWRTGRAVAAAPAVAALLSACAYRGGLDEPVERKLSWFSYLDGADIRSSCAPGAPDRYRLVYNGDYERQVRSYEVTGDGSGGAYVVARVSSPVDLSSFSLDDVEGPWRWRKATARLSPAAYAGLRQGLADSGFAAGAPQGLTLYSAGFYWVASGCEDGTFHFAAWAYPDPAFAALVFPKTLLAADGTGVPLSQPHPVSGDPSQERGRAEQRGEQRFALTVRRDGIGLLVPPL